MAKNESGAPMDLSTNVTVTVDVTKIVKYLACAGVFIVGIIFCTKCCHKMMEEGLFKI
jgi:hypothetical protein